MMIYDLHLQRSCLLTKRKLGLTTCRERFTFMGQNTLHPFQVLKMCFCSNRSQFTLSVLETFKELLYKYCLFLLQNTSKITKHRQQNIKKKSNYRYIKKKKGGTWNCERKKSLTAVISEPCVYTSFNIIQKTGWISDCLRWQRTIERNLLTMLLKYKNIWRQKTEAYYKCQI